LLFTLFLIGCKQAKTTSSPKEYEQIKLIFSYCEGFQGYGYPLFFYHFSYTSNSNSKRNVKLILDQDCYKNKDKEILRLDTMNLTLPVLDSGKTVIFSWILDAFKLNIKKALADPKIMLLDTLKREFIIKKSSRFYGCYIGDNCNERYKSALHSDTIIWLQGEKLDTFPVEFLHPSFIN